MTASGVALRAVRSALWMLAIALAVFPSVMKLYETSHWFREDGDPSTYDDAKDWFDNSDLPFYLPIRNSKILLRVYIFNLPYVASALLIAVMLLIPQPAMQPTRGLKIADIMIKMFSYSFSLPAPLVKIGLPSRVSAGEVLGVLVFLALNLGTGGARVYRSLARGSRELHFLVDAGDAGEEPIDPVGWQAAEVWGKTIGILTNVNLGWYCFLPIGKRSVFLELFGTSWERAIKYHRWIGYYTCLLMFTHGAIYVAVWVHGNGHSTYDPDGKMVKLNLVPWGCDDEECDDDQTRTLRVNMYGFAALFFVLIMTGFSLDKVRRSRFDWFYYVHHLFLLVLVFACLHYDQAIIYLIPGLSAYAVDKLIGLVAYKDSGEAEAKLVSNDVIEISFPLGPGVTYRAGQYILFNVPEVSFWQWHPFSLTSGTNVDGNIVRFHVKGAGEWTKAVVAAGAASGGTLKVRIDGFYGQDEHAPFAGKDGAIFVGGGVGVTPMLSMALDLLSTNPQPVTILWIVRTVTELTALAPRLCKAQREHGSKLKVKIWLTLSQLEPNAPINSVGRWVESADDDTAPFFNRLQALFKASDADGSGALDAAELNDEVVQLLESLLAEADVLHLFDTDGDGSLSVDEIKTAMDVDGDGQVTLEEFVITTLDALLIKEEAKPPAPAAPVMKNPFVFKRPGPEPIPMALMSVAAMLVALGGYALSSNIGREQEIEPQDKLTLLDLGLSFLFILLVVGLFAPFLPLCNRLVRKQRQTAVMDSGVDSFGFDAPAHLRAGSGKPPRDGDLIKAMVAGRVGSRPDMRAEFTEFANALHTAEGSDSSCFSQTPEVGVLACGPTAMITGINAMCNKDAGFSLPCGADDDDEPRAFFSVSPAFRFTDEEWDW